MSMNHRLSLSPDDFELHGIQYRLLSAGDSLQAQHVCNAEMTEAIIPRMSFHQGLQSHQTSSHHLPPFLQRTKHRLQLCMLLPAKLGFSDQHVINSLLSM